MTEETLRKLVKLKVERLGSQRKVAQLMGVSDTSITDVLSGKKGPGVKGILKFYGLKKQIVFVKDGEI